MKRIIWSIVVMIICGIGVIAGINFLGNTVAECDGKIMGAGDRCVSTSKSGKTTSNTAEEELASQKAGNWAMMGGCGLVVIVCCFQLAKGIRERKQQSQEPQWQQGPPPEVAHWEHAPQPQEMAHWNQPITGPPPHLIQGGLSPPPPMPQVPLQPPPQWNTQPPNNWRH